MSKLKKIWTGWADIAYFLCVCVPVLILYFVGLYWIIFLFANLEEDTTLITNTAFAISATLAALSFSCAKTITDSEEISNEISYSGERFFHSAIILLTASLLKYSYLSAKSYELINKSAIAWSALSIVVVFIVGSLFFWALISAHGGLLVLNKLLWKRFGRHPKWDNLI